MTWPRRRAAENETPPINATQSWPSEETEPPVTIDLPNNPEVWQLLEDQIAQYEMEWLDTSVPVLSGQTPREAAADAIGRESLIRLLASFPESPYGLGMSATRLRAKLGLD